MSREAGGQGGGAAAGDSHLLWEERGRRSIGRIHMFDIQASTRRSASGQEGEFCIVEAPDWVNVVPVMRGPRGEERLLMVRQYRQGARMVTTEFPAGLVDPGEDPPHAAARELREETGRTAGRLTHLATIAPNPAFMTNRCHVFLAEDLSAAGASDPDELELLETRWVEAGELERELGRGEFVNSLVLVAWMLYRREREGKERGADRN